MKHKRAIAYTLFIALIFSFSYEVIRAESLVYALSETVSQIKSENNSESDSSNKNNSVNDNENLSNVSESKSDSSSKSSEKNDKNSDINTSSALIDNERISFEFKVHWNDDFNKNNTRVSTDKLFQIYAEGKILDEQPKIKQIISINTLNSNGKPDIKNKDIEVIDPEIDEKIYRVYNLPKYDKSGNKIEYSVELIKDAEDGEKSMSAYIGFDEKELNGTEYASPGDIITISLNTKGDPEAGKIFGCKLKKIGSYDNDNDNAEEKISDKITAIPNLTTQAATTDFSFNMPNILSLSSMFKLLFSESTISFSSIAYGLADDREFTYYVEVFSTVTSDSATETPSGTATEITRSAYAGEYLIIDSEGNETTSNAVDGIIRLKSGETAVLTQLPESFSHCTINDQTALSDAEKRISMETCDLYPIPGTSNFEFKYIGLYSSSQIFNKAWNDGRNTDNMRPSDYEEVDIRLGYIDGGNKIVIDENNITQFAMTTIPAAKITISTDYWYYEYSNLPTHDIHGNPIEYAIIENGTVDGYLATYPESSDTDIVNTVLTSMEFNKKWNDNSNSYSTRPNTDTAISNFVLYTGSGESLEESSIQLQTTFPDAMGYVEVSEGDSNTWNITVKNLPKYDEDTNLFIEYSVKEKNELKPEDGNTLEDDKNVVYSPTYNNSGAYLQESNSIFEDGTLNNTLNEVVTFNGEKKWADDSSELTTENRPSGTLYLYRYPNLSGYNFESASPVQGTTMDIPSANSSIEFADLPRFDENGIEYIYFVKEVYGNVKPGYNYKMVLDNDEKYTTTKGVDSLLFNEGTLTNRRTGVVSKTVTKTWNTAARQADDTSVVIKVDGRISDSYEWENLYSTTMSGFKAEEMSKSITISLPQFDENGMPYDYRVYEDSFTINTETVGVGPEGAEQTYEAYGYEYEVQIDELSTSSIKISNTLVGKTEFPVKKKWTTHTAVTLPNDPITYNLYRDGAFVTKASVTADTNWNTTFSGLEKYDSTGKEYNYTIVEGSVSGYHTTYSYTYQNSGADRIKIANINNIENTTRGAYVTAIKEWKDDTDLEHRYPVEFGVRLVGDENIISKAFANESNNWHVELSLSTDASVDFDYSKYEVVELGMRKNESSTYYAVTPGTITGIDGDYYGIVGTDEHLYKVSTTVHENASSRAFTVTNTRIGTLTIDITKEWIDGGNYKNERKPVTFNLNANETSVQSITLDNLDGNIWTTKFAILDKYDENGKIIDYRVEEIFDTFGTDYTKSLERGVYTVGKQHTNDTLSYKATNKLTGTITDFSVHKMWLDDGNSLRPDIYLQIGNKLVKDDTPFTYGYVDSTWDVSKKFHWIATFADLPKYTSEGFEITYHAIENASDMGEYVKTYYKDKPNDDTSFDFDGTTTEAIQNGGTVINKKEAKLDIKGTKTWTNVPASLAKEHYPDAVFSLNYSPYESDDIIGSMTTTALKIVDANLDGETVNPIIITNGATTYNVNNLQKYDELGRPIQYSLTEQAIDGFRIITPAMGHFNITNEYNGDKTGHITGIKEFEGLNEDIPQERYPIVTIELYRQMQVVTNDGYSPMGDIEKCYTTKVAYSVSDSSIIGTFSFNDIEIYGPNAKEYKYWYKEVVVNGYDEPVGTSGTGITIDNIDGLHDVGINSSEKDVKVSLTNTYTGNPRVTIGGIKTWDDDSNKYNTRPSSSAIELKLFRRDGTTVEGKTYEEEVTDVSVTWSNTTGDNWSYAFNDDFEKYAPNGRAYTYIVKESSIYGYNSGNEVSVNVNNQYTANITNKLDRIDFSISKKWIYDDEMQTPITDNAFGLWDEDMIVTFELYNSTNSGITKNILRYGDGETDYNVTGSYLRADDGTGTGNYTFEQLPRFDKDTGELYTYYASEVSIKLNDVSYKISGGSIGAYKVETGISSSAFINKLPSTYLFVQKEWNDEDNRDGIRPDSVTFTVSDEDGDDRYDIQTTVGQPDSNDIDKDGPADDSEWERTWPAHRVLVPKQGMDGKEKTYSFIEHNLDNYTPDKVSKGSIETTKYSITDDEEYLLYHFVNTHEPKMVSITAIKEWKDEGWAYAYRPDSVDVALKRTPNNDSFTTQGMITSSPGVQSYTWSVYSRYNDEYRNVANTGEHGFYKYTVEETDEFNGYKDPTYTGKITEDEGGTVTITNTLDITSVAVKKIWDDSSNRYESRPIADDGTQVEVELQRTLKEDNNDENWETVTKAATTLNAILTVPSESDESDLYTFTSLPSFSPEGKEYVYRVKETKINETALTYNDDDKLTSGSACNYIASYEQIDNMFVITNTIKKSDTNIIVRKIWDDDKNQDGQRPENITVTLIRDGEFYAEQILTSAAASGGAWEYVFKNLPLMTNAGNENSSYDVVENINDGDVETKYTSSVAMTSSGMDEIYTFTNSYEPETYNLTVEKKWENDELWASELRPTKVAVTLCAKYNNGEPIEIGDLTTDEATKYMEGDDTSEAWTTASWVGLPKQYNPSGTDIAAGVSYEITYYVTEEIINNDVYRITYSDNEGSSDGEVTPSLDEEDESYTITVTNALNVEDFSVEKIWNHGNTIEEEKATNVSILLYRTTDDAISSQEDYEKVRTEKIPVLTLSGLKWSHEYEDLPSYDKDGNKYYYKAVETTIGGIALDDNIASGYTMSEETTGTKTSITNTRNVFDYNVIKKWEDQDDRFGIRSDIKEVVVELQRKLKDSSDSWTIVTQQSINIDSSTSTHSITFKDIPLTNLNDEEYEYKVIELQFILKDYKGSAQINAVTEENITKGKIGGYDFITEYTTDSAIITNTQETITLSGIKTWIDQDDYFKIRPDDIYLNLYNENTTVTAVQNDDWIWAKDSSNDKNEWSYKVTNLPRYQFNSTSFEAIQYSIGEEKIHGYEMVNPTTGKASGNIDPETGNITEVSIANELITISLSGIKVWDDMNDYYGLRPDSLDLILYNGENEFAPNPKDEYLEWTTKNAIGEPTATWSYIYTYLPKTDKNGNDFDYSVEERTPTQYEQVTPSGMAKGSKDQNGNIIDADFENRLKTVTIAGVKIWDDFSDHYKMRPDSLNIKIKQNSNEMKQPTTSQIAWTTEGNIWTYTITDIPKVDNEGNDYSYTISEEEPTYYTKVSPAGIESVNAESSSSGIITMGAFKNKLDTVSISGIKTWDDDNNYYGMRPDSLKLIIHENSEGKEGNTTSIMAIQPTNAQINWKSQGTTESAWEYEIVGLPKYVLDEDRTTGTAADYLISEKIPTGYALISPEENPTSGVVELDTGNIKADFCNKLETITISGIKTWIDDENYYEIRPDEFDLKLNVAQNDNLMKTQPKKTSITWTTVSGTTTQWAYTITNIPKYTAIDNTTFASYSIQETTPSGYRIVSPSGSSFATGSVDSQTGNITGVDFVNELITISLSGIKVWDDMNDYYGLRPDSLDLTLYNGENEFASNPKDEYLEWTTKNAIGEPIATWSYIYTYLPKTDKNGDDFDYSVKEKTPTQYEQVTPSGMAKGSKDENGNIKDADFENRLKTVTIAGVKIWDDLSDHYKMRPDSLNIKISQNSKDMMQPTTSQITWTTEGNIWTYTITDIPKVDNEGNDYSYTISEVEPTYYTKVSPAGIESVSAESSSSGIITMGAFKNKLDTVSISGIKTWDDNSDYYKLRPDTLTLLIYENGTQMAIQPTHAQITWTTNDGADIKDEWSYVITGLPANIKTETASRTAVYGIAEEDVTGYEKVTPEGIITYGTTTDSGDIVNADFYNKLETLISIAGVKIWDDQNDYYKMRPDSIKLQVDQNGTTMAIQPTDSQIKWTTDESITGDFNKWTYEITGLPKYDSDGIEANYRIAEIVPNGYTRIEPSTTDFAVGIPDEYGNMTVSAFTNTLDVITVSGMKTWQDNDDYYGLRPDSLELNLYSDGDLLTPSLGSIKWETGAGADNQWSYVITGLPKSYATDGSVRTYTIEEIVPTGYAVTSPVGATTGGIVNTTTGEVENANFENTLQTVTIAGVKMWDDLSNQYRMRPNSLKLNVYNGTSQMDIQPTDSQIKWTTEESITGNSNKWNYIITGLPLMDSEGTVYDYAIREVEPDYYTQVAPNKELAQIESSSSGIITMEAFRNRLDTITISGIKEWEDNDDYYGMRPESLKLSIYENGKIMDVQPMDSQINWTNTNSSIWYYEITGVPLNITYSGVDGTTIASYTIMEQEVTGYAMTSPVGTSTAGLVNKDTFEVTDADFKNTLEVISIAGIKTWADNDDYHNMRPDSLKLVVDLNGTTMAIQPTDSQIKWTTDESITGDSNKWTYEIIDLPKHTNDGNIATYRISENIPLGYIMTYPVATTFAIGEPVGDGSGNIINMNFTNSLDIITMSGVKIWNDNDDYYKLRPDSIELEVYANGTLMSPHPTEDQIVWTTDAGVNKWSYVINGLPKKDADENLIEYTIKEKIPTGYSMTSPAGITIGGIRNEENKDIENADFENTIELITVSGVKTWDDKNDLYGMRPDSLNLIVYENEREMEIQPRDSQIIWGDKSTSQWPFTIINLPKYDELGREITYGIDEQLPKGYIKTSPDGLATGYNDIEANTIINANITNRLAYVTVSGMIAWEDSNNYYGMRPGSVELIIYQNGTTGGLNIDPSKIIWDKSNGNVWTYTITELPRYITGTTNEAVYTISEVDPVGYEITDPVTSSTGGIKDENGNVTDADFKNTLDVINISGTKIWEDFDNYYKMRPDSLKLFVDLNGTTMAIQPTDSQIKWMMDESITGDSNKWTYEIINLPKFTTDGNIASYGITESEPSGYDKVSPGGMTAVGENDADGNIINVDFKNVLKKVSVSGTKYWNDQGDKYGLRPDDLEITVLQNGTTMAIQPVDYIQWNKDDKNSWHYVIMGLPDTTSEGAVATYSVIETVPDRYKQDTNVTTPDSFKNDLITGNLSIAKERLGGNDGLFTFYVMLDGSSGSTFRYTGDYMVIASDGGVKTANTTDGYINIKGGERFIIEGIPKDYGYEVCEKENRYFEIIDSTDIRGSIESNTTVEAVVTNSAIIELSIENTSNDNAGIGGMVTVVRKDSDLPTDLLKDSTIDGETEIAWTPEKYWTFDDSFKIIYEKFPAGEDIESEPSFHEITVKDFINEDGTLKPITDSVYDDLRAVYPGARIIMENEIITLTLPTDGTFRSTNVQVSFVPTLKHIDMTEGGKGVEVVETTVPCHQFGFEVDGVTRYVSREIKAAAYEGYEVVKNKIYIGAPGCMNDSDESRYLIEPDADGRFSIDVDRTLSADCDVVSGVVEYTYKSGKVTDVRVTLDKLSVPLDIGVQYAKIPTSADDNKGDNVKEPKTSDEFDLFMLILAAFFVMLLMSIAIYFNNKNRLELMRKHK